MEKSALLALAFFGYDKEAYMSIIIIFGVPQTPFPCVSHIVNPYSPHWPSSHCKPSPTTGKTRIFSRSCELISTFNPVRQCYYAGSRCGRCSRGQMCCATNVDGNCEMACVKGVSERRKEGTCPAGTTHRATGGIGWVHAFCHWARATKVRDGSKGWARIGVNRRR